LTSSDLESDESDNGGADGKSSKNKGDSDSSGGLEDALYKQDQRKGVNSKVASQVQSEVENEWLRCVENTASALFLRPLNGDILATEEGIVKEDDQV